MSFICWYRDWQAVSLVKFLFQVTIIHIGCLMWVRDIQFVSMCLRIVT